MREKILAEPNGELLLAAIEETAPPPVRLGKHGTWREGGDFGTRLGRTAQRLPRLRTAAGREGSNNPHSLYYHLEGEYRRQTYVGAAVVGFVGDVGIRAEVAYGGPTPFPEARSWTIVTPLSQNKSAWKGAVGGGIPFSHRERLAGSRSVHL